MLDRGGRNNSRQMRAFQKLGDNPFGSLGVIVGSGLVWSPTTGMIALELATNSGLEFTGTAPADKLTVNVDENFGLSLNASGIRVDIAASSGLEFVTGDLAVNVDENFGLSLNASGIRIDLATVSGLEFSSGDLRIDLNSTILTLTAAGLETPNFSLAAGTLTTTAAAALNYNATTNYSAAAGNNVQFFAVNGSVSFDATGGGAVNMSCANDVNINTNSGSIIVESFSLDVNINAFSGNIQIAGAAIGFYGVTPVTQQGTYTITAAPAVSTALNADANAGAYTSTPVAFVNAATLADLNDLRADVASLSAVLRQLVKHLGNTGLVIATGY